MVIDIFNIGIDKLSIYLNPADLQGKRKLILIMIKSDLKNPMIKTT